jgi:hypothetical protein
LQVTTMYSRHTYTTRQAKGRRALLAKHLDPPLPGRNEDPARSPFPARDAQKQFT